MDQLEAGCEKEMYISILCNCCKSVAKKECNKYNIRKIIVLEIKDRSSKFNLEEVVLRRNDR